MVERQADVAVLSQDRLAGLRALGEDLVAEVMRLFLDGNGELLSTLQFAASAEPMDLDGLLSASHTLRGSAANLGFDALALACWQLEQVLPDSASGGPLDAVAVAARLRQIEAAWEKVGLVARGLAQGEA